LLGRGSGYPALARVASGRGIADRPKLAEALRLCRLHGATLVIAKLDRLARNVHFVSSLMESGVEFVAVDFPQANRLTIHILAAVAEHEAKAISERTKAALAAANARGRVLVDDGARRASLATRRAVSAARAADIAPVIAELRASGVTSLLGIASALHERGIPAPAAARRGRRRKCRASWLGFDNLKLHVDMTM
jgi:DNA invertase Pin-like site-specific DNA recombinase